MIRLFLAILAGKCTAFIIRAFTRSGASAAPGLVALYVDPKLIQKLSKKIPQNIVVTGTNGKTTTAGMIAHIFTHQGIEILHNGTGSNLSRGVASKLVAECSIFGRISHVKVGIWEADEAAFVDIVSQVKPKHIILLNLFRDQLDRYGEINTIIEKWKKTLESAPWKKTIYINGDDGHLQEFKKNISTSIQTFGIANSPVRFEKKSDEVRFNVKAQILAVNIDTTEIVYSHNGFGQKVLLPIVGAYNVYNFLAAYLVAIDFSIASEEIVVALASFMPAFGRMEKIQINNRSGLIALIKNPTGTTQVLETIQPMLKKQDALIISLNDNIADGTDVSWIWDANFEHISSKISKIYVTGTRRFDMALRLMYAGINKEIICVETTLGSVFNKVTSGPSDGRVFIFPTYTALLELQEYLREKGYKNEHWHASEISLGKMTDTRNNTTQL